MGGCLQLLILQSYTTLTPMKITYLYFKKDIELPVH